MREIIPSLLAQDVQQYTPLLQEFESLHTGCHVNIEQITWEEAWSKLFNYTIHGEGRMFQRLDRTGAMYWLELMPCALSTRLKSRRSAGRIPFSQQLGKAHTRPMKDGDKDADEFIDYAVDGANHMQRLINDLLSYSRVGTRDKPPEPVPADAALDRALENLKLPVEESKAEVKREPLPTVTADDVQLIQVFQNLIANAIKFRGNEPPRIFVACQARGTEWVFSVRDNGIGIDPQYLERIFIIIQRLHRRSKYPGTGIGLAICKKIIQRHGGRIWAESKPGEGSIFFFTLPRMGGH